MVVMARGILAGEGVEACRLRRHGLREPRCASRIVLRHLDECAVVVLVRVRQNGAPGGVVTGRDAGLAVARPVLQQDLALLEVAPLAAVAVLGDGCALKVWVEEKIRVSKRPSALGVRRHGHEHRNCKSNGREESWRCAPSDDSIGHDPHALLLSNDDAKSIPQITAELLNIPQSAEETCIGRFFSLEAISPPRQYPEMIY